MAARKELKQAIGRLIIGRLAGTSLDAKAKAALQAGTIGGIILFKDNAKDLRQLASLAGQIIENAHHLPIIGVDEEGGAVQRFEHILTPIPSAMALAACPADQFLKKLIFVISSQLKMLGFNCLLAPVMDVLTNALNPVIATRAFGDNPTKVTELVGIALESIKSAGLISVGKHFPGHGSTAEDSHLGLAQCRLDSKSLWQFDLLPYRSLLKDLPAILVGHIWLDFVDESPLPATLSKRVVGDILRQYLGYNGVVMTDDLTMKAITERWGLEEASALALEAGVDLLLVLSDTSACESVSDYLLKAVKSGRFSEERILASVERVDACFNKVPKPASESQLVKLEKQIEEARDLSVSASLQSICLLRGTIPPITSGNWLVFVPNHARYPFKLVQNLRDLITADQKWKAQFSHLQFTEVRYSLDPSPEEAQQLASECVERNCLFLSYRSLLHQGQMLLGSLLAENAREKISICCDLPFDLLGLPGFKNCIATFDPSDQAMLALATVLLSGQTPTGSCPVSLEFQLATQKPYL